jgi:hypothetical protein
MALLPFGSVCVSVFAGGVPLQVRIDDPNENKPGGPKEPIQIPEVDIEDYTLTFDDSCLGCELCIVDENDNVVYTTTITSNTLVLPSTLSGEYELQIISGIYCFYGYIEL